MRLQISDSSVNSDIAVGLFTVNEEIIEEIGDDDRLVFYKARLIVRLKGLGSDFTQHYIRCLARKYNTVPKKLQLKENPWDTRAFAFDVILEEQVRNDRNYLGLVAAELQELVQTARAEQQKAKEILNTGGVVQ